MQYTQKEAPISAAQVVGTHKSAVSNALSRLRDKFNDDLFVRTGSGWCHSKTEMRSQIYKNALTLIQKCK